MLSRDATPRVITPLTMRLVPHSGDRDVIADLFGVLENLVVRDELPAAAQGIHEPRGTHTGGALEGGHHQPIGSNEVSMAIAGLADFMTGWITGRMIGSTTDCVTGRNSGPTAG